MSAVQFSVAVCSVAWVALGCASRKFIRGHKIALGLVIPTLEAVVLVRAASIAGVIACGQRQVVKHVDRVVQRCVIIGS